MDSRNASAVTVWSLPTEAPVTFTRGSHRLALSGVAGAGRGTGTSGRSRRSQGDGGSHCPSEWASRRV